VSPSPRLVLVVLPRRRPLSLFLSLSLSLHLSKLLPWRGGDFARYPANAKAAKNVAVLGAGLMGAGIVEVSIPNGYKVTLMDASEGGLARGLNQIEKNLAGKVGATPPPPLSSSLCGCFFSRETSMRSVRRCVYSGRLIYTCG
jgi:hypothetical protein